MTLEKLISYNSPIHMFTQAFIWRVTMQISPIRLTQKDTANALGISVDGLTRLIKNDPSFPRPLKLGTSRQAHVYFDYQAVIHWHKQTMTLTESVVSA